MATPNEILLDKTLTEYVELLQADFVTQNVNATGKLSKSLRVEVNGNLGRVFAFRYIGTVDEGREPGKMPPVEDLEAWIKAKKLDLNAWAVALSIAKKGTLAYQSMLPPGRTELDLFTKNLKTVTDKLVEKVGDINGQNISDELFNQLRNINK